MNEPLMITLDQIFNSGYSETETKKWEILQDLKGKEFPYSQPFPLEDVLYANGVGGVLWILVRVLNKSDVCAKLACIYASDASCYMSSKVLKYLTTSCDCCWKNEEINTARLVKVRRELAVISSSEKAYDCYSPRTDYSKRKNFSASESAFCATNAVFYYNAIKMGDKALIPLESNNLVKSTISAAYYAIEANSFSGFNYNMRDLGILRRLKENWQQEILRDALNNKELINPQWNGIT